MDAIDKLKQDVSEGRVDIDRLIDIIISQQRHLEGTLRQLEAAKQRIEELEKKSSGPGASATAKVDQPFSLRAEEKRQRERHKNKKLKLSRRGRRGRLTSADKIKLAERIVPCFPEGVPEKDCKLSHTRPVWRLEQSRAVLIAYQIYRAPGNRYGKIPGVLGPENSYRLLVNEVMRLMLDKQLFTFVTAAPAVQPNQQSEPVSGTNNEAERTLRNPAMARATGRTNKTPIGARRQSIIVSVLESLRLYLPSFTLGNLLQEIERWWQTGQSCFTRLLKKMKLPSPSESILDKVMPAPDG